MDVLAHTLWPGAALALVWRGPPLQPRTLLLTMALGGLPDVLQLLPITLWWLAGEGTLAALYGYAVAWPGQEPALPPWVHAGAHHLHCIAHSAVVAAGVTLLLWALLRRWWLPLLGWWSHVLIDVFTHSADFYPSPVLYPFTQAGFDGLAWNTPWFMALNYVALAGMGLVLLWRWAARHGHGA